MNKSIEVKRTKFEFLRKFWHSLTGITLAACYQYEIISKNRFELILTLALTALILIEFFRQRNHRLNELCLRVCNPIIRNHEIKSVSGAPYYLLGCLFVVVFFSETIAILSILYLAIGDSIASFCGRKWGNHGPIFINGKSYVGLISAIIACTISSYAYLTYYTNYTEDQKLMISFVGGIIGGTSEMISLIDDNLFIPIFSGFGLFLFFNFF